MTDDTNKQTPGAPNPPAPTASEKPKQGPKGPFGVYQLETGSLTLGDFRLFPLTAVSVSDELADRIDEEENPVRFFSTLDKANENIAKLKAKFAAQKPKAA